MLRTKLINNLNTLSKTQSHKVIEDLQKIFTNIVIEALKTKDLLSYEQYLLKEALEEEIPYQKSAYEERYKRLAKNTLVAYGIIYNHYEEPKNITDGPIGLFDITDDLNIRF